MKSAHARQLYFEEVVERIEQGTHSLTDLDLLDTLAGLLYSDAVSRAVRALTKRLRA